MRTTRETELEKELAEAMLKINSYQNLVVTLQRKLKRSQAQNKHHEEYKKRVGEAREKTDSYVKELKLIIDSQSHYANEVK